MTPPPAITRAPPRAARREEFKKCPRLSTQTLRFATRGVTVCYRLAVPKGENLMRRFVCVLAAALAFAAPASAETVLKVSLHSDLKIIDPIWTTALISAHHGNMVYDTLFALDDK